MLLLLEQDLVFEKNNNKRYLVFNFSFGRGKIVFALLRKAMIFYMNFTII